MNGISSLIISLFSLWIGRVKKGALFSVKLDNPLIKEK